MKSLLRGASGVALFAAVFGASPAFAQEPPATAPAPTVEQIPPAPAPAPRPASEDRVVVTGQLIAGATEDAPLPVEVFSLDDLKDQGAPSAAEFLRALNISSEAAGASDGSIAGAGAGFANVNLRGLGASRTMILVNGHRWLEGGANGADISQLPMMAVGQIDVLKDGASVTYGAGAVGGVINYITRRDVDGFEINADHKFVDKTRGEDNIEVLWGKTFDAANILLGASYTKQYALRVTERDWAVRPYKELPGAYLATASNPSDYYTFNPATGAVRNQIRDYTTAECRALGGELLGVRNNAVAANAAGACSLWQQPSYNLAEEETYTRGYFELNVDLTDTLEFHTEVQYGKTDVPRFYSTTPSLANGQKRATETAPSGLAPLTSQIVGYFTVPYTQTAYNALGVATGTYAPNPYAVEFYNRAIATGTAPANVIRGDLLTTDSWRPVMVGGNPLYEGLRRYESSQRERWGGTMQLKGDFVEDGFFGRFLPPDTTFDYSVNYSLYSLTQSRPDFITSRVQDALRGYGGANCQALDRVPTVIGRIPVRSEYPAGAAGDAAFNTAVAQVRYQYDQTVGIQSDTAPGTNGCQYFNPFASSFASSLFSGATNTAYRGAGFENSPELIRWMMSDRLNEQNAEAFTVDATYSGVVPFFELPGGQIGWALGSQWRNTETELLPVGTNEELVMFAQNCPWGDTKLPPNYVGQGACSALAGPFYGSGIGRILPQYSDRQVISYFGEVQLPILDNLNVQAAARRESFGPIEGDIWKVAGKYDLFDWLSFRASYSTNFQAPPDSVNVVGPQPSGVYTPSLLRTVPTTLNTLSGITPEDDIGSNIGVIFAPMVFGGQLRASVDFWEFTIDKEIANTALSVVLADVFGTSSPTPTTLVRSCNPAVARFINFVSFVDNVCNATTSANQITNILQYQLNTGGFFENGLDFKADYTHDLGPGEISFGFDATQVLHYKVKGYSVPDPVTGAAIPYLGSFNGLGSTNFTRAGTVMPEWRGNAFLRYNMENHNFALRYNYISGVQDDNVLFKVGRGPDGILGTAANPGDDEFATYGYYPSDWSDFDFTYIYAPSFVTDLELRVSILNIFDDDPMPAQNANSGGTSGTGQNRVGYLNGFGDPRGRQIEIGVSKRF